MQYKLVWDEAKRKANLTKHGLDFAEAADVLDSLYRLDIQAVRHAEKRTQSFSYVMGALRVLTVVHVGGTVGTTRVISYRRASAREREIYYDWISNEHHDA